ncbi:putative carboxylesterase, type B, carboxylesterase type B, carboxylesterase type B, active [Septoria linicola]|nr:putative carboxylesterase, type B, carboxylesterase type B, carboxylesterase type B, active [Septoria linicola]
MRLIWSASILVICIDVCATHATNALHSSDNNSLLVDLGYGIYQGHYNATIDHNVGQGIRYAAPPTGDNRWRAPQSPTSSDSIVLKADTLPERCPQTPNAPIPTDYDYAGSEDCLFLSVYAPSNANNLPVWFWIHGQGDQDIANISRINDNRFVSVVIQYRLGALGFLAGDEVKRFGDVNVGLLDQQCAMQWVQNHIAKFGGDPRRVTIAGQSAGAGAVTHHAMAYSGSLGTKLFQNAIAATPYLPVQYHYSDWQPSQAYYALAAATGCFPAQPYGNTTTTILDFGASGPFGTWAFLPVIDDCFFQERFTKQLLSDTPINGQRLMTGNTANEAATYVDPTTRTDADFEAWLRLSYPLLSSTDIDEILHVHYPASDPNTSAGPAFATCGDCPEGPTALTTGSFATGSLQRAINLYSESTFVCSSYWLARAYNPTKGKKAWKYQYSVPAAQHGADLNAAGLRAPGPNVGDDMYEAHTRMWGNMVVNNDPTLDDGSAAEEWPLFVDGGDEAWEMLNLNQTGGGVYSSQVLPLLQNATQPKGPGLKNDFRIVDAYGWEGGRGRRCEFWERVAERVPM